MSSPPRATAWLRALRLAPCVRCVAPALARDEVRRDQETPRSFFTSVDEDKVTERSDVELMRLLRYFNVQPCLLEVVESVDGTFSVDHCL